MKVVVQRVSSASVSIGGKQTASIGRGFVILLGIKNGDTEQDAHYLAEKCAGLRVFDDAEEKMNLALKDVDGCVLVVSQFTLYGDARKGNRPSFVDAAPPAVAEPLYESFIGHLRSLIGSDKVAAGQFRAMMDVALVNNGPVTILIESKNL